MKVTAQSRRPALFFGIILGMRSHSKRMISPVRRAPFCGSAFCLLSFLLLLNVFAPAQETAVITFTLDFPGSEPSHYVISVSSDNRSTYDSDGKLSPEAEGEPFHLNFSIAPSTGSRVFDLARRARYFEGQIDSGKRKLASTGAKTLSYQDAARTTSATYNYSPLPAVQQLTQFFQSLSSTLEFGRRLQYFHRYQKLALDEELKRMEEMAKDNGLEELPAVVPILQSIASDSSVINPVRARAQRMVERAALVTP
jgi:hypothetical protein